MRVDVDREGSWTWFYFSEKPNDAVIAQLRSLKSAHGGKYTTKVTRRKKYGTPGAWYIRTWVDPKRVDSIMAMQGMVPDAEPFDPHPEVEDRRGRVNLTWGYNEPGPLEVVAGKLPVDYREPGKAEAVVDYAVAKAAAVTQVKHGVEFTSYPVMPSDVKNQTDAYLAYAIKLHQENRPKTGGDERKMVYDYVPSFIKPILPSLYDTEKVDDPVVLLKWFTPDSSWTYYVIEVNQETQDAFGLVDGHDAELGYSSIEEMARVRGPSGLAIERDLHWTPVRLSQVRDKAEGSWPVTVPEIVEEAMEEVEDYGMLPAEVLTRAEATEILTEAIAKADNSDELPVIDIGDVHERVLAAEIIEEKPPAGEGGTLPPAGASDTIVPQVAQPVNPTAEAYAELDLWFEGTIKQCKRGISKANNIAVLEYAALQPLVKQYVEKLRLINKALKKLRKEAA